MKRFQQPTLLNDKEQLNNRLKSAEFALTKWEEETVEGSDYTQEHIDKNIKYFSTQVKNINKKLN